MPRVRQHYSAGAALGALARSVASASVAMDRQRRLADASLAIHSARSLETVLEVAAATATELVGCRWTAIASISDLRGRVDVACVRSGDWSVVQRFDPARADQASFARVALERNAPLRLPNAAVPPAAMCGDATPPSAARARSRGWYAVPLQRADGTNMGLIEVAGCGPRFTDDDEAVLVQLSHIASIAVENVLLAREQQANELKDEFLATLSHELRTPLNAILGWTRILGMPGGADGARLAEGLAVIERSVRAQNRLIEDLLDVSRIARGEVRLDRRIVDLGTIVQASLDAARPNATARRIELTLAAGASATTVFADAGRLRQVLDNLLSNSLKFTPAGGHVEIRLAASGGDAEIAVVDDGQGIAAPLLPFVFERFWQAEHGNTRRFDGLGIGLTIAKHLVEAHAGTIRIDSAGPNCGTTVTIGLPLLLTDPAAVSENEPHRDRVVAPSAAGLAGVRVLVVDDQPDARDVAMRVLAAAGAQVQGAGSVGEALAAIRQSPPDLVISDLAMPEESGFALIARLRKLESPLGATPAIALSALASPGDRAAALAAGFQVHAAKPCDPEHLVTLAAMLTLAHRNGERTPAVP